MSDGIFEDQLRRFCPTCRPIIEALFADGRRAFETDALGALQVARECGIDVKVRIEAPAP